MVGVLVFWLWDSRVAQVQSCVIAAVLLLTSATSLVSMVTTRLQYGSGGGKPIVEAVATVVAVSILTSSLPPPIPDSPLLPMELTSNSSGSELELSYIG